MFGIWVLIVRRYILGCKFVVDEVYWWDLVLLIFCCYCGVVFGICLLGSGCISVECLHVGVYVYDGFWEGGFEFCFPFPDAWVNSFFFNMEC